MNPRQTIQPVKFYPMCTQNGDFEKPHEIGAIFQRYVRHWLFVYENYELLHESPPFTKHWKYFAKSALEPDYKFRDRITGKEFYVEVKYRTPGRNNSPIRWTYRRQFDRYLSYNEKCPTFLILGVGGGPRQPALVTLIPIERTFVELFMKLIKRFKVDENRAITPEILWSRLRLSLESNAD